MRAHVTLSHTYSHDLSIQQLTPVIGAEQVIFKESQEIQKVDKWVWKGVGCQLMIK